MNAVLVHLSGSNQTKPGVGGVVGSGIECPDVVTDPIFRRTSTNGDASLSDGSTDAETKTLWALTS